MVPQSAVIELASVLDLDDDAFFIGGQALSLWAERYARGDARLSAYGPFTTKDVDYFGSLEAATKIAEAFNGYVEIPSGDNNTPELVRVVATIQGVAIEIDFVVHVMGVEPNQLKRSAVQLIAPISTPEGEGIICIPVMHPLHCFQSRIANILVLKRSEDLARRQANASLLVLNHYLDEMLVSEELKEVQKVLRALTQFISTDIVGRHSHEILDNDPLEVLRSALTNERLDARFRDHQIAWMVRKVEHKRRSLASMSSRSAA